jgi:hypothetical protein
MPAREGKRHSACLCQQCSATRCAGDGGALLGTDPFQLADPRCRCASREGQNDQVRVVHAAKDEPGPLGIAERFFELRAFEVDVAADAFSPPPRMRALGTQG